MLTFCVLALLAQVPQAAPATARPEQDLSAQAAALRKVHGDGKPLDLRAYEAEIELTPSARNEDSHAVRFQVRYLRTDEQRLLRYGTEEQGRRIERGLDRVGPWTRGDAAPISLLEAERAQELAEFRRHLRLAEQLARYLDPAALVDELTGTRSVRRQEPQQDDRKARRAIVITGEHATLPLYFQAHDRDGPKRRVGVELWLDDETGRLTALLVQPLDNEGKPTGLQERITFTRWAERDGRLLPSSLWISVEARGGAKDIPAPIRIDVHKLLLDPELASEDFDRKR